VKTKKTNAAEGKRKKKTAGANLNGRSRGGREPLHGSHQQDPFRRSNLPCVSTKVAAKLNNNANISLPIKKKEGENQDCRLFGTNKQEGTPRKAQV